MKQRQQPLFRPLRPVLSCVFIALFILSCKKDTPVEIKDLAFPADTYYVPLGGEIFISINQGNNRYKLDAADDALIESETFVDAEPVNARIYVSGLKKGSTELTVTDEVSQQKKTLTIHVVDPFLVMKVSEAVGGVMADPRIPAATQDLIRDEAKSFGPFHSRKVLILQHNAARRFLVFDDPGNLNTSPKPSLNASDIQYSGTYEFGVTQDSSPFDEGELRQLVLFPENDEEPISLPVLASSQYANQVLTGFIENKGIHLDRPPVADYDFFDQFFSFHIDLTPHFKPEYDDNLQYVTVFHQVRLWQDYHNYGLKIGDGILK